MNTMLRLQPHALFTMLLATLTACDAGSVVLAQNAKATDKASTNKAHENQAHQEKLAALLAGAPDMFAPTHTGVATIESTLRSANVTLLRNVGNTSLVFYADFHGEMDAAIRPDTYHHPRGFKAELAAYILSKWLRFDNVPPVVARIVPRDVVEKYWVRRNAKEELPQLQMRWVTKDKCMGVAIYWVPKLTDLGFDTPQGIDTWSAWLSQKRPMPESNNRLAVDMSNLVLFDFLIANFDRISGANLQGNGDKTRVIIRDQNLAFMPELPEKQFKKILENLMRVERFSRNTVLRLQALDRKTIESLMKEASPDLALLDKIQINELIDRQQTLLSRIQALIDLYGEDKVLAFP